MKGYGITLNFTDKGLVTSPRQSMLNGKTMRGLYSMRFYSDSASNKCMNPALASVPRWKFRSENFSFGA